MQNNKHSWYLIAPSWVVNFMALTLGLLIVGGTIILSQYQGSELHRQIFEVQERGAISAEGYDTITDNIASNDFLNSLPLLIVWACVGLIVYYFSVAVIKALTQAAELRDQLNYVHVSREARVREAVMHLAIRAAGIFGWFIFIKISLSVLLPYALAAANIAGQSLSLQSAGYALLAVAVIYVAVCVHAVFLRLILLRARVIGG